MMCDMEINHWNKHIQNILKGDIQLSKMCFNF